MKNIALSPCLICKNETLYNWTKLYDVLDFASSYLDCCLDTYVGSFYHENNWLQPPACEMQMFSYVASNILPLLIELSQKGESYKIDEELLTDNVTVSSDFVITNHSEFLLLQSYLLHINNDCILFLGESNSNFNEDYLTIEQEEKDDVMIPVVKETYTDKTGHFNNCLFEQNSNEIFTNAIICRDLDREMKIKAKNTTNPTLFKEYGKYIALRNKFTPYISSDLYMNTDYYIRDDKKYIISVDLLHGTFEVFHGSGEQLWFAEYSFSGEELDAPKTNKELNIMRQTHKVHKRHH